MTLRTRRGSFELLRRKRLNLLPGQLKLLLNAEITQAAVGYDEAMRRDEMHHFFGFTMLALATAFSAGTCTTAGCLPEGQCRDNSDCADDESCVPPWAPHGCGACIGPDTPCTSDTECKGFGEEYICAPAPCDCNGGSGCVRGCTADSECRPWEFCGPDHRCTANACTTDKDCPANFICSSPSGGHCTRKPCDSDSDCDDNCVLGMCHDGTGTCSPPVP